MNTALPAILILVGLGFAGCGKKKEPIHPKPTNAPASGKSEIAPGGYLGAVAKAKKTSERTIDTVSLNQAVQFFQASEGRLPKDLNELVTEKYLPRLPDPPYGMKIVYDASNGQVKVVPQ